ncbi:MAG TPA: hypothetical protein VGD62_14010 [Acidobacteriaceae bacterium]
MQSTAGPDSMTSTESMARLDSTIVPPARTLAHRSPVWVRVLKDCALRWHLCSVDAPSVALVWALALGRMAGRRLPFADLALLAFSTWTIYVLDRVLDGLRPGAVPLEQRHYFAARHRRILLPLCGLASAAAAALCWQVPRPLLQLYLLLGAAVLVYAAQVHSRLLPAGVGSRPLHGFAKEGAVAVLFTAAVLAPAWVAAAPLHRPALLGAALLLGLLCWLNCALISHAEGHGSPTARAPRMLLWVASAAAGLVAAAASLLTRDRPAQPVLLSLLLSSLSLAMLLRMLPAEPRPALARRVRVLADLALLTPLLFLLSRP